MSKRVCLKQFFYCISIFILMFSGCASKQDIKPHVQKNNIQATIDESDNAPGCLSLDSIRIEEKGEGCRIGINTNTVPTYTMFKLSKPDRLIIDLPGFKLTGNSNVKTIQNKHIEIIKATEFKDEEKSFLRMEVVLKNNFSYNAVCNNNILNIDLSEGPDALPENPASPEKAPSSITSKKTSDKQQSDQKTVCIKDIKISENASSYKVSILADSGINKYKTNSLKNPNRLVIDIFKAKSLLKKPVFQLDNPFIDKIRIGQKQDKVRIVIDLKGETFPVYQIGLEKNTLDINLQRKAVESPAETEHTAKPENSRTLAESSEQKNYKGKKISLDFKDADIKNVLRLIADISGLNMIISNNVTGSLTLKLENIPWDEAFEIILDTNNLGRIDTGHITRIETIEHIKKINHEKLLAKKSQEDIEELVLKTFRISYAKADDLKTFIQNMGVLSERGSITPFGLTNKLTVQDIPVNVDKIYRLIQDQDIPTRQVLIEARIVQSNPSYVKELGVSWGGTYNTTHNGDDLSVAGAAGGTTNVVNLLGPANGGIAFGYITDKLALDVQLSAMENADKIKIVSNPRILGLNNKEARIKQGVALPYLKLNDQGVTSTEFKDAVLELTVTPQITPSDTIALHLFVTKNQKSAQTGAGNEPGIDIREVETDLLLGSGETVVIGGIYETTESENVKKVPFFGDLPLLGYFFKNTKNEDQITELLVFMTVTVVGSPTIAAQSFNNN